MPKGVEITPKQESNEPLKGSLFDTIKRVKITPKEELI